MTIFDQVDIFIFLCFHQMTFHLHLLTPEHWSYENEILRRLFLVIGLRTRCHVTRCRTSSLVKILLLAITQADNLYNEIEYGKVEEDSEERRPRNFQVSSWHISICVDENILLRRHQEE